MEEDNPRHRSFRSLFFRNRPDVANHVATAKQWKQIHSSWLYLECLVAYAGPPSHLIRKIWLPLSLVMSSVLFNAFYHLARYLTGNKIIELDTFSSGRSMYNLTSFAIPLMLTFRLYKTYERWLTSTQSFMRCGGLNLQIVQLLSVWCDEIELVKEAQKWCIVSIYALVVPALQLQYLPEQALKLLSKDDLSVIQACPNMACVRDLSTTRLRLIVKKCKLNTEQFIAVENLVSAAYASAGDAILASFIAMPLAIRLVCSGFLMIWLIIAPFGIFSYTFTTDSVDLAEMVLSGLVLVIGLFFSGVVLLSIDQIATDLEYPFEYIPVFDLVRCSTEQIEHILHSKTIFDEIDNKK